MKSCPECSEELELPELEDLDDGEVFSCANCGEEIEVVFLDGGGYCLQSTYYAVQDDSSNDSEESDHEGQDGYGARPTLIDKIYE